MYSYKKEVLCDDADYNVITVVMANEKTDFAGALQWISNLHDEIVHRFLNTREDVLNHRSGVPSWGRDIDLQVAAYIDGLGVLIWLQTRRFYVLIYFTRRMGQRAR